MRAAGPRAEVSQAHPGSGTDFTAGRSGSSRTALPQGSAASRLGDCSLMVRALRYRGEGTALMTASWLSGASPHSPPSSPPLLGFYPGQNSFSSPISKREPLIRSRWSRRAGSPRCSQALRPVPLVGLASFPRTPAGWDRRLADVSASPSISPGSGMAAERGAKCPGQCDGTSWGPPSAPAQKPREEARDGDFFAVLGLSRARLHFRSSHVSREGMVNPRPPLMSLNWE